VSIAEYLRFYATWGVTQISDDGGGIDAFGPPMSACWSNKGVRVDHVHGAPRRFAGPSIRMESHQMIKPVWFRASKST